MLRHFLTLSIIAAVITFSANESACSQTVSISVETGGVWFSNNEVRIPNEGGTTFDMLEIIGSDASPYLRLYATVSLGERHTVRALIAPLSKSGTGIFNEDIFFEETTFDAGVPIDGTYQFNTYRFTYRYTFYNRNNWKLGAGAAALIRDAKVELIQPDRSDSNTDLGFVPLLHIYAERNLGERVSIVLDGESLAARQGRATDVSLTFNYSFSENWTTRAGYRLLEGGADVDDVYNFSWINFGLLAFQITF